MGDLLWEGEKLFFPDVPIIEYKNESVRLTVDWVLWSRNDDNFPDIFSF